jgi:hypothetical protein
MFQRSAMMVVMAAAWASAWGAELDLRGAKIVIPANPSRQEMRAAGMLQAEVEARTQLRLPVSRGRADGPSLILGRMSEMRTLAPQFSAAAGAPEGFTVRALAGGSVAVAGNDDRGVVFGTGFLLRQLRMNRQRLQLAADLNVTTAPRIAIRGHQLGYRPKTNSYDAWTVPMWDQYIRELAIFGTNTIELIPPRSDDAPDSPHFPLPQIEMMVEMSRIADEYGLDVSVWYPALDKDYSDPKTVEFALREWGEVFRRLPRIDAVFVPGGDPGHTQPKFLMAMLEKQAASLRKFHPRAEMWVAPQGFSEAWMDEFLAILRGEPQWLNGIVFGPQNRLPLADLRERVPQRYGLRLYPDITHSFHAQYPVADWDWAFALTEGREGINPRPLAQAAIFRNTVPLAKGFVAYSEGCNDDVNKIVWSALGWNPDTDIKGILREYGRFFIGDGVAEAFAEGLLDLERNWRGPVVANGGIDTTLLKFQELERNASPRMRLNWRFQQALYRAYYDAVVRHRAIAEAAQEERAMGELAGARRMGSLAALTRAESVLDSDPLNQRTREWRARVFELAEALYQSIRMQLSVARYQAIGIRRGANLDGIDLGLNNRAWLKAQFAEIRRMVGDSERLAAIDRILNWTNPGPGGFYDDLGDMTQQPRLLAGEGFEKDPEFRRTALMGSGPLIPDSGVRISWFNQAEVMWDGALRMRYPDLDPQARYRLRVVYGGDRVSIGLRANGGIEIHPHRDKPAEMRPEEFDIPHDATRGGTLLLEWTRQPGAGGAGRGAQVAEVWLIRVGEAQ